MLILSIILAVPSCPVAIQHSCERHHEACLVRARDHMQVNQREAVELFASCLPVLNKCLRECSAR
jgi:hypothetical protein